MAIARTSAHHAPAQSVALTQQEVRPPIPDINNNRKLDGEDIAHALESESISPSVRSSTQRAHGVMEVLGTRDVTQALTIDAIQNQGYYRLDSILQATQYLKDTLLKHVETINDEIARNPRYLEDPTSSPTQPFGDLKLVDDLKHFAVFARSFEKTFPQGVDIKPEEILGIIQYFGPTVSPEDFQPPRQSSEVIPSR